MRVVLLKIILLQYKYSSYILFYKLRFKVFITVQIIFQQIFKINMKKDFDLCYFSVIWIVYNRTPLLFIRLYVINSYGINSYVENTYMSFHIVPKITECSVHLKTKILFICLFRFLICLLKNISPIYCIFVQKISLVQSYTLLFSVRKLVYC